MTERSIKNEWTHEADSALLLEYHDGYMYWCPEYEQWQDCNISDFQGIRSRADIERIAELEHREKHLIQVIYNVAKYSFKEGRFYTGHRNLDDMSMEFATKVQKEYLGGDV